MSDPLDFSLYLTHYRKAKKQLAFRYFSCLCGGLILLLGGIIVFCLNDLRWKQRWGSDVYRTLYFLMIVAMIGGIVVIGMGLVVRDRLSNNLKKRLQKEIYQREYAPWHYESDGKLFEAEIAKFHLFRTWDIYRSQHAVDGTYHGVAFQGFDMMLNDYFATSTGPSSSSFTYAMYRVYVFPLKTPLAGECRITVKPFRFLTKPTLGSLQSEYIAFNKAFEVSASSKEIAFSLLTPDTMERLIDCEAVYHGKIALVSDGVSLWAFFPLSGKKDPMSFFSTLDEAKLQDEVSYLRLPGALLEAFGLYHFRQD
jgi:hypothetical protein